jgi:hypothetical protein
MDWNKALAHLASMKDEATKLVGTPGVVMSFYLMQIEQCYARFNTGERTQELYDEIMGLD